ncbi:MAG: type I-E CRISPR-associated protein Cas5/CasD [Eubacteriaceae bacterium]|nr:type I-E CRISPR-associated protein Cas5/CasD [Eubacteriaceae bacterium]
MSTLLLRLAAPLQAWGTESKFERRATEREPSKSGVIGLLAAALGRRRNEPVDDLAGLKFGVRVDKAGQIVMDFHTALGPKQTYVTKRLYLEDAVFLVGLEGNTEFLKSLESAVNSPFFPLFLGRRSCPPTGRICLGVREVPLKEALLSEPFEASKRNDEPVNITLYMDTDEVGVYRQRDLPVSFSQAHRKYTYRYIKTHTQQHNGYKTEHDAFEGVGP